MTDKSNGVVTVKLPVSEFVDRYLISVLKLKMFKQAGKSNTQELEQWIHSHDADYQSIVTTNSESLTAAEKLAEVHAQLWELEDLVRSPEAEKLEYFAATAKQIFDLNTTRHKLKHTIDQQSPSMAFGPRLYDKGTA